MSAGKLARESSVYLSVELIINILKRLPVKSLLRFISVCKSWYSLIKNPAFISTHLSHQIAVINNQSELGYLLFDGQKMDGRYFVHCDNELLYRTQELFIPETPPDFKSLMVSELGICNGIVFYGSDRMMTAFLWNPSLKKLLRLEIPHTVGPIETNPPYKTVFYNYHLIHGVGFDSSTNDYKFVSVAASNSSVLIRLLSVCVYSLNERAWKAVTSDLELRGDCIYAAGVHLNGVIHWLIEDSSTEMTLPVSILTFNLADETFGEIPLPDGADYDEESYADHATVTTVPAGSATGKNLAFLDMNDQQTSLKLWVMETCGVKESWRLVVSLRGKQDGFERILNVMKNGEVLVELEGKHLGFWNPTDMRLKHLFECYRSTRYIGPYMETLALL